MSSLQRIFSYNFEKNIRIDSVQISREWDHRGTYFLCENGHWRYRRQSHHPASYYTDVIYQKMDGYRAINAIDYSIINDPEASN